MRKFIYDQATGEIKSKIAPCQEHEAYWTNRGYAVLTGENGAGWPESHRVVDGEIIPKTAVTLTPDKNEIAADDIDRAVVSIQVAGQSPPAGIDIEVDGVAAAVSLAAGQGQLAPVTSPVEHVFTVRVSDRIIFNDNGGCAVAAVEQE